MSESYFEDQVYEGVDYAAKGLTPGQYEACTFVNCNFSDSDLSGISFTECIFRSCNLSMTKMKNTSLNDAQFFDCKMLGINYEHCGEYLFTVKYENCVLDFSSFYKRGLKKTSFKRCSLREVEFIEADCSGAVFDGCDLGDAKFENTNLEKADLRTAFGYTINPELNRLKKAQFALTGLPGLLTSYDILVTP